MLRFEEGLTNANLQKIILDIYEWTSLLSVYPNPKKNLYLNSYYFKRHICLNRRLCLF